MGNIEGYLFLISTDIDKLYFNKEYTFPVVRLPVLFCNLSFLKKIITKTSKKHLKEKFKIKDSRIKSKYTKNIPEAKSKRHSQPKQIVI